MNISTDVHFYDGKLKKMYKKYHTLSETDKIKLLDNYSKHISNKKAKKAYHLIVKSIGLLENLDVTNNIDASDILCDVILHPGLSQLQYIFEEQLADILEGKCSQGRADRLLQIWMVLYF